MQSRNTQQMEVEQKSCAVCGLKSTNKCSACKQLYYCSREHQKSHWKVHKKECGKMTRREEKEKKPLSVELECAVCGISESSAHLMVCANCRMAGYCCKEHQLQHWNHGHSSLCSKVESMRAEISNNFARLPKNEVYKDICSQFQGDFRFEQLKQDLENGAMRTWLRHALELSVFLAEANIGFGQFHLGGFYCYGFGVKQDAEEAVKWFRIAAEKGIVKARCNLGICYMKGEGVPKDLKKALEWCKLPADQGIAKAQTTLGMVYYSGGDGVPRDMRECVKWYRKAAIQGDVHAQINLGGIYGLGDGVPEDLTEAEKWMQMAADQGIPQAANLVTLMKNLDNDNEGNN